MKRLFLFTVIFFLGAVVSLRAQIAVFPFEDISKDINGIDLETTRLVIQELEKEGIEVVPLDRVLTFLVNNRLRWTGWVERLTALKVYRQLGAELILLGTVTEKDPEKGIFGVALRLVRATDYKLLWGRTLAQSSAEKISFLELKKFTYEQIVAEVIKRLLEDLPEELQGLKVYPPAVEIADVFVRPRYVKANHLVECAVKLNFSGPKPEKVFFVLPEGKRIAAVEDHQRELYLGVWKAPQEEGRYPVNLVLKWGPPWNQKKKLFLSSFIVDNTPPKLSLKIRHGERIGETIAFRRYVTIVPVLERSEPITRWQMVITGEQENEVLNIEEPGSLPESFNWRGTDASGHKVPVGRYQLKLFIWDKAGNKTVAEQEFLVVKDPPEVDLEAQRIGEQIELKMALKDHPVPLSNWYIDIWDEEGNLLKEYEGEGPLKGRFLIPFREKLYYSLEVRDILGNRYRVRSKKLQPALLRAAKEEKEKKEKKWLEDF